MSSDLKDPIIEIKGEIYELMIGVRQIDAKTSTRTRITSVEAPPVQLIEETTRIKELRAYRVLQRVIEMNA